MTCCGPPKKCCTCTYYPPTQPDECRCGCGYHNGVFQVLLAQFLLFCGFWFAVATILDCSFVELGEPIVVRQDGAMAQRVGLISYTDMDTERCYFWTDTVTFTINGRNRTIWEDEQLQFYWEQVLDRPWFPTIALGMATVVVSFLWLLYVTSYACSTQVRECRFFNGFLIAIVFVILQGLMFLVLRTDWCLDNQCETSRTASYAYAACVSFLLSGIAFFFMSDYPGKDALGQIQEEHHQHVMVGDQETTPYITDISYPDDREEEPPQEDPLPGDEHYEARDAGIEPIVLTGQLEDIETQNLEEPAPAAPGKALDDSIADTTNTAMPNAPMHQQSMQTQLLIPMVPAKEPHSNPCTHQRRRPIKRSAKVAIVPILLVLLASDTESVDAFLFAQNKHSQQRHSTHPMFQHENHGLSSPNTSTAPTLNDDPTTETEMDDSNAKTLFPTDRNTPATAQLLLEQEDPFQATGQQELIRTLAGGPALIFEMARKSMFFVKEVDAALADTSQGGSNNNHGPFEKRWHPYSGVSDDNPSFRTQSPPMNNQGFAKSIWRNVRKRNKPSLWRHALRTYDRMTVLEKDPNFPQIYRSNTHHEGAMLACAKLGLWQRALEIYHEVYQLEMESQQYFPDTIPISSASRPSSSASHQLRKSQVTSKEPRKRKRVKVTDDMVLSLVKACVRASRIRSKSKHNQNQSNNGEVDCVLPQSPELEQRETILRRIPLDTSLELLSTLPEEHGVPLTPYLVNPLAAAYQTLGYVHEARELLQTMLSNRTAGEDEIFNVYDLHAKDKGSYSLLVEGALLTGEWGEAVEALSEMTKSGLYPDSRHCNGWSEISERQTRPRAVGSWKKKRDDIWADSIR